MKKLGVGFLRLVGRGLHTVICSVLALALIAGGAIAANNYLATVPGSGTSFAGILISAVIHPVVLLCDATLGEAQCAAVTTSNAVKVDGSAVTQPASIATWAGGTLGSMANYGTSPGAVLVPGANVFVTNTNANGQATGANSSPVVLPAAQVNADPCATVVKTNFTISTTSGTLQIVAPSGSTQVYICSLVTVGATASIQNIVGGTGANCTTGTPIAMAGSTTAANGMSFAANGGFTFGNGGGDVLRTTTAGHGVCLIQSGTAQISGGGTYVQQ